MLGRQSSLICRLYVGIRKCVIHLKWVGYLHKYVKNIDDVQSMSILSCIIKNNCIVSLNSPKSGDFFQIKCNAVPVICYQEL